MATRLALKAVFPYLPARKAGLDGTLVNPVRSGTKQPHASPCRVRFSLPLLSYLQVTSLRSITRNMSTSHPSPTIVVILAGGQAERFGGVDKGGLMVEGERLIDRIVARINDQADSIVLSAGHNYGLNVEFVTDLMSAPAGPVGGIYSVYMHLKNSAVEGFYTVPVDGPNVPTNLIAKLHSPNYSSIASDGRRHPTFAWWRMRDLEKVWESWDGLSSISLNNLATRATAQLVEWKGGGYFVNINYPRDLEKFVKGA